MINEEPSLFPPNIPHHYAIGVNKLIEQKNKANTLKELKNIFTNFGKKYTPITYLIFLWKNAAAAFKNDTRFSEIKDDINNLFKGYFENCKFSDIVLLSQTIHISPKNYNIHNLFDYFFDIKFNKSLWFTYEDMYWIEIDVYKKTIERYKKLIEIPHNNMEKTMRKLTFNSDCYLDAGKLKKFSKAHEINEKIIQHNSDDEKWFNSLIQIDDQKCIEKNVRYRISKYPFNKELWKLYINYLKNTNIHTMLKTYSRYCRLFFNDQNVLEKYRTEIEKYGFDEECVTKFWIDTIEFERTFVSAEAAGNILKRALKSYTTGPKGLIRYAKRFYKNNPSCINLDEIRNGKERLIKFDYLHKKSGSCMSDDDDFDFSKLLKLLFGADEYETVKVQKCLPETLIFNIIERSSIKLLQKLFHTCKNYNKILRRLTCHNLWITDETKFGMYGQALFLPASNTILNFNAIFLTNALNISSKNTMLLSILLPSITSCNIRSLFLKSQYLTLEEYEFLTQYGNIQRLHIFEVHITDELGSLTPIEKIISRTPKAFSIIIEAAIITSDSAAKLSCLNHICKIKLLFICEANTLLNILSFCDFITKHCDTTAHINIVFKNNDTREFQLALLKSWKNHCKIYEKYKDLKLMIQIGNLDSNEILTIANVEDDNL